jgi:dTDP-4-dehydrorhamnose 3,5-epimerase
VTEYWSPKDEHSLVWNDPEVGIEWPLSEEPVLSSKDAAGARFRDAAVYE